MLEKVKHIISQRTNNDNDFTALIHSKLYKHNYQAQPDTVKDYENGEKLFNKSKGELN